MTAFPEMKNTPACTEGLGSQQSFPAKPALLGNENLKTVHSKTRYYQINLVDTLLLEPFITTQAFSIRTLKCLSCIERHLNTTQ